jgi:threonine/homoserine/homoserine lactone efflux protein
VASFLLFITPGPDMSLWLSRTIVQWPQGGNRRHGGHQCRLPGPHPAGRLWRVGADRRLRHGLHVLKIVGALYLLWLAVDAIRNGSSLNVKTRR